MKTLIALIAGLTFGAGLILSGMTDPARVLGFLDVTGDWRPALALVMGAAVIVAAPAFAYARRHGESLLKQKIALPNRLQIDRPLLLGAAIFGLGWGLSGICPGPAFVLLGLSPTKAATFIAAFLIGGWLVDQLRPKSNVRPSNEP